MEVNTSGARTETNTPGPGTPLADAPGLQGTVNNPASRTLSDTDVVFYMDDQKSGLYCGRKTYMDPFLLCYQKHHLHFFNSTKFLLANP